jgi:hypothetical protein
MPVADALPGRSQGSDPSQCLHQLPQDMMKDAACHCLRLPPGLTACQCRCVEEVCSCCL